MSPVCIQPGIFTVCHLCSASPLTSCYLSTVSQKNSSKIPLKKLPIITIVHKQWIRELYEGLYLSSKEHSSSLFWFSLTALKPVSSHSRLEIDRQVRTYLVCTFLLHACIRLVCCGPQKDKRLERRPLTSDKHKT